MFLPMFVERDACLLALSASLCGETRQHLEILTVLPGSFVILPQPRHTLEWPYATR
jgi:hypothetical protein